MRNSDYFYGDHITTIRNNGELQVGNNNTVNATVIVYTVAPNFELMLTDFYLTGLSNGNGICSLAVYDATPVLVYYLCEMHLSAINYGIICNSRIPPDILPTGYSIRLTSTVINLLTRAGIRGFRYPVN